MFGSIFALALVVGVTIGLVGLVTSKSTGTTSHASNNLAASPGPGAQAAALARACVLYEKAAPTTARLAQLRAGDTVVVLRTWNGWRQVQTADGKTGWTGPVCW